jgi:prevent-host-death family protein
LSLSLIEDIKTVSELKKNLREILQQLRETGRPVVVTVNGKPDAVLVDVATYERKLKALNLATLLARGEEDIRRGRTRSARTFLKDFQRGKKIPR